MGMEEKLCHYGCGRPAKFGNLDPRVKEGSLPRCSQAVSDCPVVRTAAMRAHRVRMPRRLH